jgi:hypothetical protein
MTIPPLEFIDCNLDDMRQHYSENAIHCIPYCGCDIRAKHPTHAIHNGNTVVALQLRHYYDGEGEPVSDILRVFYVEVEPVDYPLYFRYRNKVYVLTDW